MCTIRHIQILERYNVDLIYGVLAVALLNQNYFEVNPGAGGLPNDIDIRVVMSVFKCVSVSCGRLLTHLDGFGTCYKNFGCCLNKAKICRSCVRSIHFEW